MFLPLPLVGLCLALCLAGCDTGKPTVSHNTDGETETPDRKASASSEQVASDSFTPPILDDGAVDAEGLVVLGEPESDQRESAPATTDQNQSTSSPENSDFSSNTDVPSKSASAGVDIIIDPPEPPADAKFGTPTLASTIGTPTASNNSRDKLPAGVNLATQDEKNQVIAPDWPDPQAVLFVSGQQHGYLEPCGCTGLDRQKGGLIRRDTLLGQLRGRGWNVIPIDAGNQVRRIGRQPEIKFQTTTTAFKMMGYAAATLGIDDLQLSSIELIQAAGSDELTQNPFISANVSIIDPSFFPSHRIVESGGRKIGITAAMGSGHEGDIQSSDVEFFDPVEKLTEVMQVFETENCDFRVLLAHASLEESAELAKAVPGFDLVVTAGGFGEPTLKPEPIEGSQAVMVQVGVKGMYGGIVGIFDDDEQPIRYQKIAISSQFKDSERMLKLFAEYQKQLENESYAGLGVDANIHPTGHKFAGSESCGDCHTIAYEIWEDSPHVHATESIVHPPNDRGGVARHFDPECISCHVTGWNPQRFHPYESGWMTVSDSPKLGGSGCENCHGPGSEHVAAEYGDIDVSNDRLEELRQQMVLPLAEARRRCLECHDLDNSPDFHADGAFDEYWERVKHYGKD